MQAVKPGVEEMNIVIAEFMGKTVYPKQGTKDFKTWKGEYRDYELFQLKYHGSWDWFMPVYKKIHDLFYGTYCGDRNQQPMKEMHRNIQTDILECRINEAHAAVYDFIIWYNQQTKQS